MNIVDRIFGVESMVRPELRQGPLPSNREAYRTALQIAAPSMCEMVFLSLIGMMDTLMVSQLGTYAISAVGLTNQPRMIMLAIFYALNVGVTAIVARRKGEGRQAEAQRCMRQSIVLISALSVVMTIVSFIVAEPLMALAGAQEDTILPSTEYFQIISAGLLVNALTMTICAALRGVGNTTVTMKVNVIANVVNVIFNYLLIGGNFGFPRLEVAGAAWATVIGQTVGLVMALLAIFHKDSYLHVNFHQNWKPQKDMYLSVVKVGSSAVVEQVAMRVGFFITARLIAELGTIDFAVNQICSQILTFSFTFADGTGTATASLVGQNLGRKRADLSQMYGKIGQRMAMVISIVLILVFVTLPGQLVGLFSAEKEVLEKGIVIMYIMAGIIPFQMSQIVMAGSLRGAGDTKFVANTMLVAVMVIRPAMTFLFIFPLNLGVTGAWVAMFVDQTIRMTLLYRRFASGKWSEIQV